MVASRGAVQFYQNNEYSVPLIFLGEILSDSAPDKEGGGKQEQK